MTHLEESKPFLLGPFFVDILRVHKNRTQAMITFLISNFSRVLNDVCFLLGNSPASEFYMPTFRNTLFHLHRRVGAYLPAYEDGTDRVFQNVGI